MDIKTYGSAMKLFMQILDPRSRTVPHLMTSPQKPPCPGSPASSPLPRLSPEEAGIPRHLIDDFFGELERDRTINPHSAVIAAGGNIIAQRSWGAFRTDCPMTTYSECKSITALAVGMCVDDGLLSPDDRVSRFFSGSLLSHLTHKSLTVRHLLTMSSGVAFGEAGAVIEDDWVRGFMDSLILFEPGSSFFYNSMNSYMLSAIVTKVTGLSMFDFLKARLFEPLGITDVFWESCPKGITKGGWGLYIRPGDLLKIALLVMNGGEWHGRRIVSREWIAAATSPQFETPPSFDRYNYGYQIWVGKHTNSFLFNGMFGQNVFCYPESGIAVAVNAGSSDFFQQSGVFELCDRYFSSLRRSALPLPVEEQRKERTAHAKSGFWSRLLHLRHTPAPVPAEAPLPALASSIAGRRYLTRPEESAAVGLFPLILQVIQNNYVSGLRSVSFDAQGGILNIVFDEADEAHRFAVGFDEPLYTDLTFHGEPYRIGVLGRTAKNEDGADVLICDIDFIETASSIRIKFFFEDGSVRMKFRETPGKAFLFHSMETARKIAGRFPALSGMLEKRDLDFISYRIDRVTEPELELTPAP